LNHSAIGTNAAPASEPGREGGRGARA
jgi:hypothetical protein